MYSNEGKRTEQHTDSPPVARSAPKAPNSERKARSMSSTDTSIQHVEEVLFNALAEMGPDRSEVKRESSFEELDIDSLDLVEMAQIVEETWGVEIDTQDFANIRTVGEALDLVIARMP